MYKWLLSNKLCLPCTKNIKQIIKKKIFLKKSKVIPLYFCLITLILVILYEKKFFFRKKELHKKKNPQIYNMIKLTKPIK